MTGREVYKLALALLAQEEQEASDYESRAADLINVLLPQMLAAQNIYRTSRGEEKLACAQTIEGLEDELELSEPFARSVLPYGLATLLILEEDSSRAAYFNGVYLENMGTLATASVQPIGQIQ